MTDDPRWPGWGLLKRVGVGFAALAVVLMFAQGQRQSDDGDRLRRAEALQGARIQRLFRDAGFRQAPHQIYWRAFKHERQLELWASPKPSAAFRLVHTWPIAGMSGDLGPKRREGDRQVPEGLYVIDRFNPKSRFRLSFRINYPNESDRVRSDRARPGSDIYVHGGTVSIGCLAMTDVEIDAIYLIAWDAHQRGQRNQRLDIFPFRYPNPTTLPEQALWSELEPFYKQFEKTRRVPKFTVGPSGEYRPIQTVPAR